MTHQTETPLFREKWIDYIYGLQAQICAALEATDGKARFETEEWERAGGSGGGGRTRVMQNGGVFEKGGVNTSVVHGRVTEGMNRELRIEGAKWFACGLSLVLHPYNPFVPTVHANWRYFELYDEDDRVSDRWFGGGTDLTPYYLFPEDAAHFHGTLKNAIEPFGDELYPRFKKWCDEYFNNAHRGTETRGIGGVFYDHLRETENLDIEKLYRFQQANGDCFLEAYLPIVAQRKDLSFTAENKYWQEIRRGRYAEFNLIHDRGTLFGLKTGGRTESILMSLPPTVRFVYHDEPAEGTPERTLLDVCRHPRRWA